VGPLPLRQGFNELVFDVECPKLPEKLNVNGRNVDTLLQLSHSHDLTRKNTCNIAIWCHDARV